MNALDHETIAHIESMDIQTRRSIIQESGLLEDWPGPQDPPDWHDVHLELFRGERLRAARMVRRMAQDLAAQDDLAGALALVLWAWALWAAGPEDPPRYLLEARTPPPAPRDRDWARCTGMTCRGYLSSQDPRDPLYGRVARSTPPVPISQVHGRLETFEWVRQNRGPLGHTAIPILEED